MIRKVKVLKGKLKEEAHRQGLHDDDLVEITLTKIEGSPTEYLQDKYLKKKGGNE